MGLLIDLTGFPIGYELFPGNTFDGKTMLGALDNIRRRFGINKVIIVADRGLNSKGNLNLIKEAGYGYVVASKLKAMKKELSDKIFDDTGYEVVSEDFRYKVIEYVNTFKDADGKVYNLSENLIASYSAKRAVKDHIDRQRLIDKATKMLAVPSSIKSSNKRGGKKYIGAVGSASYSLNESAIKKDSRYDGYYGIQTSEKEMSAEQIIEAYHTLWKIEESFRIMKSSLEVRPVFHWKPERIHGHFVVCFLSFMMERRLEIMLNESKIEHSPERIKEALNEMQLAKVQLNDCETYIKAKNKPLANHICKVLGIKLPQNINTKSQIAEILRINKKDSWGQLSLF
jgi:transposase